MPNVDGSIYVYAPNKGAPVFFALAFTVSGLLHLWQCFHYKCFKLMVLYPLCSLLFAVGFLLREYGAFNYLFSQHNLNVYIASICLIYMSPPLLELANYHILGRILYYVPYFSPLHPGRVLTTFGTLSGLVEMMNAVGAVYIANQSLPEDIINVGHIMIKIALIAQVFVIGLFCLLAGIFHRRCAKAGFRTRRIQSPMLTLYISTSLILVRTIYRIVEYFSISGIRYNTGPNSTALSPIVRYEWFFYVFEASLMLINSVLWNVRHPRRYLPENYLIYLAQDGVTELEGSGWKDDHPWIVTMFDPFGMCGERKDKEPPFWETNGYAACNNAERV